MELVFLVLARKTADTQHPVMTSRFDVGGSGPEADSTPRKSDEAFRFDRPGRCTVNALE
jgi:hypothetical protein